MRRSLYRIREGAIFGGIFTGLGEMLDIDPNILRILWGLAAVLTGVVPMVVLYLIAWVAIPERRVVIPSWA